MFDDFPQSNVKIVGKDGEVRHVTKAIVAETIVIPDQKVEIYPGDEIRRVIPSGAEETFEVLDPVFHQGHGGIPAHYQVKNRRKGTYPQGTGGNFSIHVTGANSRVNVNSSDLSQNFVSEANMFGGLRNAIQAGVHDSDEKLLLLGIVDSMESSKGDRAAFLQAYQNFVASAANHVSVIAPFLAGLAALLGG